MAFDDLAQSMLDACAETLGSVVTLQRNTPGAVSSGGGRPAGTKVEYTVTATTQPSVLSAGGVDSGQVWETRFKVRKSEVDAAVAAGGFAPDPGDTVIHGGKRLEVASVESTTNGLDLVLVCRSPRKK